MKTEVRSLRVVLDSVWGEKVMVRVCMVVVGVVMLNFVSLNSRVEGIR